MNKATSLLIAGALLATASTGLAQEVATEEAVVAKVESDIDGATPGKWTMDLDAAKALAAEKKLPILLDFSGSDWCGWCKVMEKNVFTKPEWSAYAKENLIMVLVDFPNDKSLVPEKYVERNSALQTEYGVDGFPTFIVLDDDGKTELGRMGSGRDKTPASFRAELEALFRNRPAALAAYIASLSPEAQTEYKALQETVATAKAEKDVTEKQLQELSGQLEKVTEAITQAEEQLVEFRIKQQGEEPFKAYLEAKVAYEAKEKELMDWLATQPERNDENMQKFQAMQGDLQELGAKVDAFK